MTHNQVSMFEGSQKYKIDKPIRLIQLFAGYGSQALALKYLSKEFEDYKIAEWAVKSIQAYKDMHFADDKTNYGMELIRRFERLNKERTCRLFVCQADFYGL